VLLPTLNANFSASRIEQYKGQQRTRTSDLFSLGTFAQIYPDLSSNLLLSQRFDHKLQEDGTNVSQNTFNADFNLAARLRRDLTAKVTCDYSHQGQETGSSQSAATELEVRYRPSSLLGVFGMYDRDLLETSAAGNLLIGGDLTVLQTQKARLTIRPSIQMNERNSWNVSANGSWDISKNWSLSSNASYSLATNSTYSLYLSLTYHL
jgi:hypothetical protein